MTEPRPITQDRAGMSEREYVAHAGISRGAVQKARASGRLALHADGSIDAAGSAASTLPPAALEALRSSLSAATIAARSLPTEYAAAFRDIAG